MFSAYNLGLRLLVSEINIHIIISPLGLSQEPSSEIAATIVPALINAITKNNNTTPDNDPSQLHALFGTGGNSEIFTTAKNLLGRLLNK